MSEILRNLVMVGDYIGIVVSAMMYESGFMTVDGKTKDGKKFTITLSIKEEEENA